MNRIRSLCSGRRKEQKLEPKSVDLVSGYFFNINYIVGTGFLSVPYAFYRAGTLTATVTLLSLSFISWNTANWIIETMARSQAITSWRESKTEGAPDSSNGDINDSSSNDCLLPTASGNQKHHPDFTLFLTRKFEACEMCEIFFGRYMKYFYIVVFTVYMFFSFWANATVAGSAWATNLPLNFGALHQCDEQSFHDTLVPSGGCLSAYRFCIMLFGLIVIPLSLVELTEQKHLQILLGLMRFLTFGCLIIYSVANIISNPEHNPYNDTATWNYSYHNYGHQILKFDFNGWLIAIGIIVYAQILHSGIPSMTQPIKAKKQLGLFFGVVFASTTLLYLSLGVTMSLWFKESIEETGTLNFVELAHHSSSTALRVMSYYIVLFPSLDVCSAYPLGIFALSNNLFVMFTGSDTTELNRHKHGKLILVALRLVTATLPVVAALFIANLVYIVTYAGLLGLCICYLFPIMLQLKSQHVCYKSFEEAAAGVTLPRELPLLGDRHLRTAGMRCRVKSYYTPYSNVFSHPFIVIVFGVVASITCGFIIASLTVS